MRNRVTPSLLAGASAAVFWLSGCEFFADCRSTRTCAPETADSSSASNGGTGPGGQGSGGELPPAPPATEATLAIAHKQLTFAWSDVPEATHYRLERKFNGKWLPVGGDTEETGVVLRIGLHLFDWAAPLFRVQTCNGLSCAPSRILDSSKGATPVSIYPPAGGTQYGNGIALSGDGLTLAAAAPTVKCGNNDVPAGAVYVYTLVDRVWTAQPCISIDANAGALAVALDQAGQHLVIGSPGKGLVVIYKKKLSDWVKEPFPAQPLGGGVGSAVAISGDGAVVAASVPTRTSTEGGGLIFGVGGAVVYQRASDEFGAGVTVLPAVANEQLRFGSAIALSGDGHYLAVGAVGDDQAETGVWPNETASGDAAVKANSGAVHLFSIGASAVELVGYLKAPVTEAEDGFGSSVALNRDGSALVVGAWGQESAAGAAYVYALADGALEFTDYLKPSDAASSGEFGTVAVSADGDTLVVGARGQGFSAERDGTGAVYSFQRSKGVWKQLSKLVPPRLVAGAEFGAVALSDDGVTLLVGAPGMFDSSIADDALTGPRVGAFYIY